MSDHRPDLNRGDCLKPTDPSLLNRPLDFIQEEHLREREICALLKRIANTLGPHANNARNVVVFLRDELPLHLQDEEEDLLPLLKRRCEPQDEIDKVIQRLLEDHHHAHGDTLAVITILEGVAEGTATLCDDERACLRSFSIQVHRHLILENAIILPLARLRLTESDLQSLRLRMLQRRGFDSVLFPNKTRDSVLKISD